MLGIRPKKLEYKIITYYYNVHTTILLVQTGGRGGGKGGLEASDCEGFPLASSRLAARGWSRLVSSRLEKSSRLAVSVTVAAAVAVTELRLRFAVPVM